MIWDHIFPTYAAESPDEPVEYGVASLAGSMPGFNPLKLTFREYTRILQDASKPGPLSFDSSISGALPSGKDLPIPRQLSWKSKTVFKPLVYPEIKNAVGVSGALFFIFTSRRIHRGALPTHWQHYRHVVKRTRRGGLAHKCAITGSDHCRQLLRLNQLQSQTGIKKAFQPESWPGSHLPGVRQQAIKIIQPLLCQGYKLRFTNHHRIPLQVPLQPIVDTQRLPPPGRHRV